MGTLSSLYISSFFLGLVYCQSATLPAPGQPTHQGTLGTFNIIGSSLVSAQQVQSLSAMHVSTFIKTYAWQIFVGTPDKVYFVDKVENNPTQINDHPAWASGTLPIFKTRILQC